MCHGTLVDAAARGFENLLVPGGGASRSSSRALGSASPAPSRIAHRDPAPDRAAKEQHAAEGNEAGNAGCEQRRHERRAEVRVADFGRRDDDARSERGRADDGEEHSKAKAETRYALWH